MGGQLLRVRIAREPWSLDLGVLAQSGPIAFQKEPRWKIGHGGSLDADPPSFSSPWSGATRVRDEAYEQDRYRAVLDTDDDSGCPIVIEVRLVDEATVSVKAECEGASALRQNFVAEPGERFYGFGKRSHAVSLERGEIENYVTDGPYLPEVYEFLTDTVPPWAMRERPDSTYFPIPWVLSSRGYGVLVENDELSYAGFRVDSAQSWGIEVEAGELRYTLFGGPTPLDALSRYTAATGRQPEPERWFFGPWYQTGHANQVPAKEERRQRELLLGSPASVAETHCRYLPTGEDRGFEEAERARTQFFHSEGLAVLGYINPLVSTVYTEAFERAAPEALQRHSTGEPYVFRAYAGGRVPPHTDEAQYDFTSPGGPVCWGEIAGRLVEAGYDGWMEDFGEYTPLDVAQFDGSTGTAAHNRYPTEYHRSAATTAEELEGTSGRRLARFVRSGWTGTAAVAPIVWGGDPSTSWGFNGLASAVIEGLTLGASGVAMWGSDTGGFLSTSDRLTPELLRRWIQFSAFCPVMRTKSSGIELEPHERPQIWDDDVLPSWRRWARWHTRLNDYLMASHETYRATGRPIMCPLGLVYPNLTDEDEYLFGESLLVAPVLEPGRTSREVTFPPGQWIDLFGSGRSFEGPQRTGVEVGPDDIAVFVKQGAVIALLPDDVDSLSPYAAPIADRRDVLAFPGVTWRGALGPGLRCRSVCTEGEWSLELDATREFTWDITAALRSPPAHVDVEGDWSFELGTFRCSTAGFSQVVRVALG